jgi:hypothetical protein
MNPVWNGRENLNWNHCNDYQCHDKPLHRSDFDIVVVCPCEPNSDACFAEVKEKKSFDRVDENTCGHQLKGTHIIVWLLL